MSAPTFPISLSKEVSNITAVSGTWTLILSDVDGIISGMKFDVGGFTTAAWNVKNETVDTVNQTTKAITYSHGNFNVASQTAWAQFHLACPWIDLTELEAALGYQFDAGDETWAQAQVDAACDWAYRTRQNAGYQDHPNYAPSSDVKQGVILYASQLVKQRGAVDGYASFDAQGFNQAPGQSYAQILQLLGCKRPQVG